MIKGLSGARRHGCAAPHAACTAKQRPLALGPEQARAAYEEDELLKLRQVESCSSSFLQAGWLAGSVRIVLVVGLVFKKRYYCEESFAL